jgi:uncharacterized protein (TIGR02996 family)
MSAHQSFLHAILENPLADEPRLGYADWLDQSCDPRGEFIRVQCRLGRPQEYDPCLGELELRERELLGEFEGDWAAPLAGMVDGWTFHRGFINEVMVSGRQFAEQGEGLCRLTPVQEVHLHDLGDRLAGVAASPVLARVRFLDLSENRLGNIGLRLLAKSAYLTGVRGLNLSASAAGNAGAQALAASPNLKNLEELYLSANNIGDDGARAIARSPYLEQLKTLFLNFNRIGAAGVEALRRRFGVRAHL